MDASSTIDCAMVCGNRLIISSDWLNTWHYTCAPWQRIHIMHRVATEIGQRNAIQQNISQICICRNRACIDKAIGV